MSRVQLASAKVLLTGATGGLGHAIAREIASRGADLVLTARRTEALHTLADSVGARAISADLSDPGVVAHLRGRIGPIDVLIANAGLPTAGLLSDFSDNRLDQALAVNLRAPMVLARTFAAEMKTRGQGHIVFMGSIASRLPAPSASIYNATKFGLRGFSLALRHEMRDAGIGVSIIEPGFVRDVGMFANSSAKLPFGVRMTSPEDVATAVVRAIRHDVDEIVVAPWEQQLGAAVAGVSPATISVVQRIIGADEVSRSFGSSSCR